MATATRGPTVRTPAPPSGAFQAHTRAERLGLAAGVAVPVLAVAGLAWLEGPADRPEFDAPRVLIRDYFADGNAVVGGAFLLMLSALAFLWFAGTLRAVLRGRSPGSRLLGTVAYGGAIATASALLAMPALNIAGAVYVKQLSLDGAQTIYLAADGFLYPAAMAAAVFLAATAFGALRTRALPRVLVWTGLLLAVWLLIPPFGSAGDPENPAWWTGLAVLPAVPVWTAVTALVLLARRGQ